MYLTSPSNNPEKTMEVHVSFSLQILKTEKKKKKKNFQIFANNNTAKNIFESYIHCLHLIMNYHLRFPSKHFIISMILQANNGRRVIRFDSQRITGFGEPIGNQPSWCSYEKGLHSLSKIQLSSLHLKIP